MFGRRVRRGHFPQGRLAQKASCSGGAAEVQATAVLLTDLTCRTAMVSDSADVEGRGGHNAERFNGLAKPLPASDAPSFPATAEIAFC
jgi:hypothetical protein